MALDNSLTAVAPVPSAGPAAVGAPGTHMSLDAKGRVVSVSRVYADVLRNQPPEFFDGSTFQVRVAALRLRMA